MKLPVADRDADGHVSRWFVNYWYVLPLFPLCVLAAAQADPPHQGGRYALDRIKLLDPDHRAAHREDDRGPDHAHPGHAGQLRRADPGGAGASSARRAPTRSSSACYQRVYESIREGDTIAQPLKESRLVDDMVVNMIDVGEETGDLDTMLYKIADVYDEEVNVLVESLISLLEPIMIVILGGIIGTIVIALFMPLIKLMEGLSK